MVRAPRKKPGIVNPALVFPSDAPSSLRFQPSQAYLERMSSSSTTDTASVVPAISISTKSTSSLLVETPETTGESIKKIKVEIESFPPSNLLNDSLVQPKHEVGDVALVNELNVEDISDVNMSERNNTTLNLKPTQRYPSNSPVLSDYYSSDYGITRKHPRASTSRLTLEQYDDNDHDRPVNSFSRNSLSPLPQAAEVAQEDDSFYESDLESLQSEGIQEQLVGSRTYIDDIYNTEARHMSSEDGVMNHYDDLDGEIVEIEDIDMDDLVNSEEMDTSTLQSSSEAIEDVDGEEVIIEDVTDVEVDGEVVDLGDLSIRFTQVPINLSNSSSNLIGHQQQLQGQDLLVSHGSELNQHNKQAQELSVVIGEEPTHQKEELEVQGDEDSEDEEEEGEIREDPISRRASRNSSKSNPLNHLPASQYHTSAEDFARERSIESSTSDHYGSSSNARYSKSRRLDSQVRRFSSTSAQERPSSTYHNRTVRHSLPFSGVASTRYPDLSAHYILPSSTPVALVDSRFATSGNSSENSRQSGGVIYTRRSDSNQSTTGILSTPALNSSQLLNSNSDSTLASESNHNKIVKSEELGSQSSVSSNLSIPTTLPTKILTLAGIAKEKLPFSQSLKFKSLPLKLHHYFPDLLTAESSASQSIFTQPFRSTDAPTYIPDETILHGYWPAPPKLSSGKGIFPAPTLTSVQVLAEEADRRGRVDIFVDNSNVLYSFLNWVRSRPEALITIASSSGGGRIRTAKTVTVGGKKVKLDYKVLLGILERGRKVEKRVLVGSSPLWQSLGTATKWGYEVSILQRVARPIAPARPATSAFSSQHLPINGTLSDGSSRPRITPNSSVVLSSLSKPPAALIIEDAIITDTTASSSSKTIPTEVNNTPASPTITSSKPVTIMESNPLREESLEAVASTSITTAAPTVPRFTPKGAILPPFVPVIDPITGIASTPAVSILPRKRSRGSRKNKKVRLANPAATSIARDLINRNGAPVAIASGVDAIRIQTTQVPNTVESKLRRGHGVVNNISGVSRADHISSSGISKPAPTRLQLQQQHNQQQLNLPPQQRAQDDGVIGGLIVAKHFREQAVDELLHLKILESLLDYTPLPSVPRPLLVVATGDANASEYNPTGFLGCIRRALERGWNVEIVAFPQGTSSSWLVEEHKANIAANLAAEKGAVLGEGILWSGSGRLRVVDLSYFAPELVSI